MMFKLKFSTGEERKVKGDSLVNAIDRLSEASGEPRKKIILYLDEWEIIE